MSKKTINLPIVFHFHQPVDNFESVFEDCYKKAYGPLIENIFNFPEVKFTLHFSGNLLEWFLNNKPDFIEKLKIMARRNQIELLGGGFYEPIFAIIPRRDRVAQMKKLSKLITEEFNLNVKGCWLSERVWEPSFPSFLNEAGLKYVIVDDNHFRSCGITQEETLYSYITEDEGKTLRIFPINEPIRYLIPWKPTYLTIDYLRSVADEKGDRIALMISDAEKMGVWGSTHEICYVEGHGHWDGDNKKPFIPAFFEQIRNNDWIKSMTLSEYMDKFPARSLVYLPTSSYDKMEEWVLPTKTRKKFKKIRKELQKDESKKETYQYLKGGFWRYFLVKYPESNNMHKKMLHVREKLIQIEERTSKFQDARFISKIENMIIEAWDEIYKAQCNDCYWHGMFGGVYLQFLRFSVYTHLINAEKLIDEMNALFNSRDNKYVFISTLDFNKDSKEDILIESNLINLYINPSEGGTIFELDYKPKSYNLLNTLTRWEEAYHDSDKINTEEVMVDMYRRSMLRLRILHEDVTFKQLQADIYHEFGDFVNGNFKIIKNEKEGTTTIVHLQKEGLIKDPSTNNRVPCVITKKIFLKENVISISIEGTFKETTDKVVLKRIIEKLNVGVDIPFFFNGDPNKFRWESRQYEFADHDKRDLLEPIEYKGSHFKAHDETYDLNFEIDLSSNDNTICIKKFPIITHAHTDEGYKKIYQGINLTLIMKIHNKFELNVKMTII